MSAISICIKPVRPSCGKRTNASASTMAITLSKMRSGNVELTSVINASGSAMPVVSTIMISGSYFSRTSLMASSNSPASEQQTQPPANSAMLTFLPWIISVSMPISPNSFMIMANFFLRFLIMCWRRVVLPAPR